MNRSTFKIPDSEFVGMAFDMQSQPEHGDWEKTFPETLPPNHRLAYRWVASPVNGAPRVVLFVEPIPAAAAAPAATAAPPNLPAVAPIPAGPATSLPPTVTTQQPPKHPPQAATVDDFLPDLKKLAYPDLETKAGEVGLGDQIATLKKRGRSHIEQAVAAKLLADGSKA